MTDDLRWFDVSFALEETGSVQGAARRLRVGYWPMRRFVSRHRCALPMGLAEVARLLGQPRKTVCNWVEAGYVRGALRPRLDLHRDRWLISHDCLLTFLQDRRYWHLWSPDVVTCPRLRRQIDLRRLDAPLTVKQAAARLGVLPRTLRDWVLRGHLPAVKVGQVWLIEPADLAAFQPPRWGGDRGRERGFTPEEDAYIWGSVAAGDTFTAIGRMLERSRNSIIGQYRSLQRRPAYTATLPARAHRGGMPDCARRSLVARYQAGEAINRLAWRYGVSDVTVHRVLAAEGVRVRADAEPETERDEPGDLYDAAD